MTSQGRDNPRTLEEILDQRLEANAYFDYTTLTKEQVIESVKEFVNEQLEFARYMKGYYMDGKRIETRFGFPIIRDFIQQKLIPNLERQK